MTQQEMADRVELHVNQIRRYEAGTTQPSLDALKKIAVGMNSSIDELVFEDGERGPSDELALQFEAVSQMPEDERAVVKEVLEGLIIKYQSRRWDSGRKQAVK
ncbi:helix-turn-helix transcriptional regulator [Microbulbifer aestuariivivens]